MYVDKWPQHALFCLLVSSTDAHKIIGCDMSATQAESGRQVQYSCSRGHFDVLKKYMCAHCKIAKPWARRDKGEFFRCVRAAGEKHGVSLSLLSLSSAVSKRGGGAGGGGRRAPGPHWVSCWPQPPRATRLSPLGEELPQHKYQHWPPRTSRHTHHHQRHRCVIVSVSASVCGGS